MKSLKRAIVEKLGKLNECGGGGYYHPSSGSGSCGGGYSSEPPLKTQTTSAKRRVASQKSSDTIKNLTADIYGYASALRTSIDAIIVKSSQLGKRMPTDLKTTLTKMQDAAKDYVDLIDFYTSKIG